MDLTDFIEENIDLIMGEWIKYARTIPPGMEMDMEALRDDAEGILLSIVSDMRAFQNSKEQEAKSKELKRKGSEERTPSEKHAYARRTHGFDINELGAEFRALRATVMRLWKKSIENPDLDAIHQVIRFNEAMDQELFSSIRQFSSELDRSRELFTGIIGHDLRSPLNVISMSAQYQLQDESIGPNSSKAALRILINSQQMEKLIADLLDVTRLRLSGAIPLHPQYSDLASICEHVLEQTKAAHPECSLVMNLSDDLQGYWDPARLTQVLSNLVENAVKHGNREKTITITAREEGEAVLFSVHNLGREIPKSSLPRIFDPLFSMKSGSGSFGLGLYIACTLVRQHKGAIHVESSNEEGTTFTVSLPRNKIESGEAEL